MPCRAVLCCAVLCCAVLRCAPKIPPLCLQAGMERKDVMGKNVAIYKGQAAALEKNASKDCKVGSHRPLLLFPLQTWCGWWALLVILTGPARGAHGSQCLVAARC
jgi:hypothetical protein